MSPGPTPYESVSTNFEAADLIRPGGKVDPEAVRAAI